LTKAGILENPWNPASSKTPLKIKFVIINNLEEPAAVVLLKYHIQYIAETVPYTDCPSPLARRNRQQYNIICYLKDFLVYFVGASLELQWLCTLCLVDLEFDCVVDGVVESTVAGKQNNR